MKEIFRPGNMLRVRSLNYGNKASKMLVDMGITPDTMIFVDKAAPLGEPLVISVRNYQVALRKKDLMALDVELVESRPVRKEGRGFFTGKATSLL